MGHLLGHQRYLKVRDKAGRAPRKNIVVVGGGFAGVELCRYLEARLANDWDIFLLSRNNQITYNPLLPEVVGASVLPGHVAVPLRRILKRTRIRMVDVTRIDFAERFVEYSTPVIDRVPFEHLVYAAGLDAELTRVPGVAEHGLTLRSLGDALFLRNSVIRRLEEATLTYDQNRSRALTSFIVIGGRFSGVEAAGEILDLVNQAVPRLKRVAAQQCSVHLVHKGERLLPEVSASLGRYAESALRKNGIQVHLNTEVNRVHAQGVELSSGNQLSGSTVVCTIGSAPHELIADLAFADERGRLKTTAILQLEGQSNIWAVGDCAAIPNDFDGSICPATAQFAVRQARVLGFNLMAAIQGQPLQRFSYRSKGQLATIGHRKAVVELSRLRISGFPAWLLWRAHYLLQVPTIAMKARLFFEWNWTMLFPKNIGLLDFERSRHAAESPGAVQVRDNRITVRRGLR